MNIARALGVSQVMVSYTINSDLGQLKLGLMRAASNAPTKADGNRIMELMPTTLKLMEDIIQGKEMPEVLKSKVQSIFGKLVRRGLL